MKKASNLNPFAYPNKNLTRTDQALALEEARHLFDREAAQARRSRMRSLLWCRPNRLASLDELGEKHGSRGGHAAGVYTVPIDLIRGSEGRSQDFDAEFHPTGKQTAQRWQNIALARLSGAELPPVELIQVGDNYFVRDGHHRISVAKSLGQKTIDAEVVVWD